MQPECSLPCSQNPVTGSCSPPNESLSHKAIPLLSHPQYYPTYYKVFKIPLSFGCSCHTSVRISPRSHACCITHPSRPEYGNPNEQSACEAETQTMFRHGTVRPQLTRTAHINRPPAPPPIFQSAVQTAAANKQHSMPQCFWPINNGRARAARVKSPNFKLHYEISPRPLTPLSRFFL
jgi:hypothetical protein